MLKFSQVTIILFSAVSCFNGKQQGTDSGSINFVPLASGILLSCLMFNAFEFHRTNQRIHLYLIFQGTFLLLFSSLNLPLSLTDQYTFPVKKYDFLFFIFNLASASLFTRDFFTAKQFAPLKKRSYPGFVFISGWVILSLGFLLDSKILFSNQPATEDTSYGTLTGMALQVLFSTIALSQRNSIFLQEKFKSQQSEIIALNASEKKLEAIVRKNADEMIETIGEIAEKNQNITDSIIYSLTIQRSILPPESVLHGAFKDYFLLFRPKDIVSGDFYWFCKSDKYTFVAVADCTGHGVPGALMSLVGNNFLNQIVNEKSILEPSKILGDLNRNVRIALNQENENTT
ncbi:MAG: SpoIIE family protein phosphatase, partial [Leptospira sp.]|nr:SpoIIE family protein phosphatase [Leptospira sp.]